MTGKKPTPLSRSLTSKTGFSGNTTLDLSAYASVARNRPPLAARES